MAIGRQDQGWLEAERETSGSFANALDCDLVYAFVSLADTLQELVDTRARRSQGKRPGRRAHDGT
jgi:hypothetical protein